MPSRRRRADPDQGNGLDLRHLILYALLAAIQFASKQILEPLPNIEAVSMLTMVYTLVYRKYALIPVYLFVFLEGALHGFNAWWYPYLYLWTILWGLTMLLPRSLPQKARSPVYVVLCGLFGMAYGTLYAPFQCVYFLGGDLKKALAWIGVGLPWDVLHMVGNLAIGMLIEPLTQLLRRLEQKR